MPLGKGNPLVYEINTRCWLRELRGTHGVGLTLSSIPEREVVRMKLLGITHVWLMGVWRIGPRSRAHALEHFKLHGTETHYVEEEIHGSTYAIAGYSVEEDLGGEQGLKAFREQLHRHGLKLLLDFIPNHVGLDHPWLKDDVSLFVTGPKRQPGMFVQHTGGAKVYVAHGKDPYFPPWTDTAQLDYRNLATQQRMIQELQSVAARCDGVRCDMAMLVLNEVFQRNWKGFAAPFTTGNEEFWERAISSTRKAYPKFLFLAEAYWGLEPRLLELGFDYAYLKAFYDHITARRFGELQALLREPRQVLERGAYFLENHDENRVAHALTWPEHRAAALLLACMPGLRLLHDGQFAGYENKISVHLGRRPAEPGHPEITLFYEQLLAVIQNTAIGKGAWRFLEPGSEGERPQRCPALFLLGWQSQPDSLDLVVVNLAKEAIHCRASIGGLLNWQKSLVSQTLFGLSEPSALSIDPKPSELLISAQPYHAEIVRIQPSA